MCMWRPFQDIFYVYLSLSLPLLHCGTYIREVTLIITIGSSGQPLHSKTPRMTLPMGIMCISLAIKTPGLFRMTALDISSVLFGHVAGQTCMTPACPFYGH